MGYRWLGVGLLVLLGAACASASLDAPLPDIGTDPNASLAGCVAAKQIRLDKHNAYITAAGYPVILSTYIPPASGEPVTETWLLAINTTTADDFTFTRLPTTCQVDSVFAYTFPVATHRDVLW